MRLALIFLLAFATLAFPQEVVIPDQEPVEKRKITLNFIDPFQRKLITKTYCQEVEPALQLTKNVLFIIDCSGSMIPSKISEGISFILGMTQQPIDEMQIAAIGFDEPDFTKNDVGFFRWPGIPEPNAPKPVPPNWAALPSIEAIGRMLEWIQIIREQRGNRTYIIPALVNALSEPRKDLSIVVISDGHLHDGIRNLRTALRNAIIQRQKNGLQEVPIMAFGVTNEKVVFLEAIGQIGGGGYFHKDGN